MKKLLLIAILVTYATASFGVRFQYFYCCGNLKSVSLSLAATQIENSETSSKGCCQHETVSVQLKADQNFSPSFDLKFSQGVDFSIPPPKFFHFVFPKIPAEKSASFFSSSPPLGGLPLYKLYRVYLI